LIFILGGEDYHFLRGLMDTTKESRCFDGDLTRHLVVLSCIVTTQIWELIRVSLRDKYIKHNAEDFVLVVNHEQNTIVFVVLPELLLPFQQPQELDLHKVLETQDVYWIGLMPVVIRAEVLYTHTQWDPGRFWSAMSGEHKTDCTERSRRLPRIGDRGDRLIIGMDDLSVPWDPGRVSIYASVVPVRVKATRPQCRSGSYTLLRPEHAIAWGQAMFCQGSCVTPHVPRGPQLSDELLRWAWPNRPRRG
jgi:hypothetical protein